MKKKEFKVGSGEKVQRSRAMVTIPEDPCSISMFNFHTWQLIIVYNSGSKVSANLTDMHEGKIPMHIKYK